MQRKEFWIFIVVAALAITAGCKGGPTVFVHQNADFSSIRKVAILPFETLTQDRSVADKVQKILTIEILSLGAFEVVEPGQVQKVLREQRIENAAAMAPAEIKQIGAALGVQALLFGSVVDFGESRVGTNPAPEVTIQLRLVETQSGLTLWSASHTRAGAKWSTRLFGVGGETPTQAAQKLMRQEIGTILK
jgi:curli biogenesis system outer membrane secretion channel CsgG